MLKSVGVKRLSEIKTFGIAPRDENVEYSNFTYWSVSYQSGWHLVFEFVKREKPDDWTKNYGELLSEKTDGDDSWKNEYADPLTEEDDAPEKVDDKIE